MNRNLVPLIRFSIRSVPTGPDEFYFTEAIVAL